MIVRFEVPGPVRSKGSARFTAGLRKDGSVFRRTHVSTETLVYENLIAHSAAAAMAGRPPMTGPVTIMIYARFDVPASWSRRKRGAALAGDLCVTRRPDVSNTLKAVEDGCRKIVFADDAQIVTAIVTKLYHARPGLIVLIGPIARVDERALGLLEPEGMQQ